MQKRKIKKLVGFPDHVPETLPVPSGQLTLIVRLKAINFILKYVMNLKSSKSTYSIFSTTRIYP